MKHLLCLSLLLLISCRTEEVGVFHVLHYNIKELDSHKVQNRDQQIDYAAKVVDMYKKDIFSVNELQYDFKGVPSSDFKTRGKNLKKLARQLGLRDFETVFAPSNTGMNAQKKPNGHYYADFSDPKSRDFADQVNFGIFPGQYSTGAVSKLKVISKKIISKLKWRDFNPNFDLSSYAQANGKSLPEDMELFDKNFTDFVVSLDGREIHIILLHTVPSFNFGNKKSVNYYRNAEQLRFLEWYLTGSTDYSVNLDELGIKPLPPGSAFVAMGDWNVDIRSTNSKQTGAMVLNRLFKKTKLWINEYQDTYWGGSFAPGGFKSGFDYITTSQNIEVLEGKIHHPKANREELACDPEESERTSNRENIQANVSDPKKVLVKYRKRKNGERLICKVLVSRAYYETKMASDHLALYAKLRFIE